MDLNTVFVQIISHSRRFLLYTKKKLFSMAKRYNLTMHITPELKVFVGISTRSTWRYEGHWRGSSLEYEAAKFGWHNITHTLVEDGLTKRDAIDKRRELIETAGCISVNRTSKKEASTLKTKVMKEKQINLMANTANGVKLSLTFDNRYMSKSGYPVVVRVYKDRKWGYVPTGFSMTADEFKNCNGQTLKTLEDKYNIVKDWCMKAVADGNFSLRGAKACIKDKRKTDTLEDLMNMKIETLESESTVQNYKSIIRQLKAVFPDGLAIAETNQDNLKKFINELKKQGKSDTTINIYLSAVKASINYGIYKGLFDEKKYPFKKNTWEYDKITIPKSNKRDDRYIGIDEMRRIWDKFIETGDKWIGLFLFSYLAGGMNIADIIDLRFTKEWTGNKVIRWTRRKTAHKKNDTIAIPVSSWVEKLLDRLGIEEKNNELVFKFLEGNYYKVKSSASASINTKMNKLFGVSMTYARHSFANIMTRIGAPAILVEQAMGHSLGGVQSHYISGFNTDDMRPWFEKLL